MVNQVEEQFKQLVTEVCQVNDWIIVAMSHTRSLSFVRKKSSDKFSIGYHAKVKGVTARRRR